MKASLKPALLLAALAASALTALAQPAPGPSSTQPDSERRARLQERVKQHVAQRASDLKAQLELSAEQEAAWNTYVAAMKPPARPLLPNRADIAKLSTPERLDRMRELRQQREAEFDQRDAATRTFYGTLSAEQKKIFDDNTGRPYHQGRPWGQR